MTPELHSALDNAYDVFARYDAPRDLIYSPGVSRYLRGLTPEGWSKLDADNDMAVYIHEVNVLRHFLPRWLEWLSESEEARVATNYWSYWGLADLRALLASAKWRQWPACEVVAVSQVFLEWTRTDVASHGGQPFFQFLVDVDENLAPHLNLWLVADLSALAG